MHLSSNVMTVIDLSGATTRYNFYRERRVIVSHRATYTTARYSREDPEA
jgi:hypothetical protein